MEDEMGQQLAARFASAPALSHTEWRAVSVALNDAADIRCGVVDKPGRLSRLFTTLTGVEHKRPLADPRLETLRRFVCQTRATRTEASELVPALIEQGFNRAQIAALALLSA
jgi:hypothetical protein